MGGDWHWHLSHSSQRNGIKTLQKGKFSSFGFHLVEELRGPYIKNQIFFTKFQSRNGGWVETTRTLNVCIYGMLLVKTLPSLIGAPGIINPMTGAVIKIALVTESIEVNGNGLTSLVMSWKVTFVNVYEDMCEDCVWLSWENMKRE